MLVHIPLGSRCYDRVKIARGLLIQNKARRSIIWYVNCPKYYADLISVKEKKGKEDIRVVGIPMCRKIALLGQNWPDTTISILLTQGLPKESFTWVLTLERFLTSVIYPIYVIPHLPTHLGSKIPQHISKSSFLRMILRRKFGGMNNLSNTALGHMAWPLIPLPALHSKLPLPSYIVSVGIGCLPSGVSDTLILGQCESSNHFLLRLWLQH